MRYEADIGLTKALVTPDLTAAFNEAKGSGAHGDPGDAARHAAADARDAAARVDAERRRRPRQRPRSRGGVGRQAGERHLGHRRRPERPTVGEQIILAYRPEGATEFLGREMKEVADGRYGAEIPTSATSGGTVAYYIEAEDAEGAPIAARGSVDNPLVIHLLGVGISHRTGDDDGRGRRRGRRGPGPSLLRRHADRLRRRLGERATATRTPTSRSIRRGWRWPGVGQIAPEVGLLAELVADAVAAASLRVHHRHDGHLRNDADDVPEQGLPHGELRVRGVRQGDVEVAVRRSSTRSSRWRRAVAGSGTS